ncbi:MAG: NAD-dependent epimerase/dehydratase family protein [Ferruginibacter sp.]
MKEKFHTADLSDKSFLITGGAGFIGGHISEYLLKNGAKKVRVLDNLVNGFDSTLEILKKYPQFEFINGDIRNAETCLTACDGIDFVSHQAALGSVPRSMKEPGYFSEVNITGFVNLVKAASDKNVKQLVYASSSSVYGDEPTLPKKEERIGNALSPYAVSKRTNELLANVFASAYGMKIMGFRYFNIFGPRQDPDGPYAAVIPLFVKGILNKTPVYINGDGEQTRDFTFVDNAVQVNIKGMLTENMEALNKVYNVAVGENFTVNYLYDACKKYLKSDWQPVFKEPRVGDIRNSLADISLAKELLGYMPTKKFEDGLLETMEYFNKQYT